MITQELYLFADGYWHKRHSIICGGFVREFYFYQAELPQSIRVTFSVIPIEGGKKIHVKMLDWCSVRWTYNDTFGSTFAYAARMLINKLKLNLLTKREADFYLKVDAIDNRPNPL